MCRGLALVSLWVVAACGADGTEDAAPEVALAFTAPLPGEAFVRDDLSPIGELSAEVGIQLAIDDAPARIARVALSVGDTQLGDAAADGTSTARVLSPGPATLTATAFDADGLALATAAVDVTITDPTVADCHAWLDLYKVGYTVGPARNGVADPVTAMMPINGIAYRVSGNARTTMFGDCTLIRALAIAAPMMKSRGIVEVTDLGVYNYRCINNSGTPPNCTIGLSEHSFGTAIDLASFKAGDGTTYSVNNDWVIDPAGEKTCQAATEPGKDQFLHELACTFKANKVFNIILTPNYNALHRDHFHADLTDGADTIRREIDTPKRTASAAGAHDYLLAHCAPAAPRGTPDARPACMAITNEPVVAVDETVVPTVDRAFVTSPIGWSSILAATAITLGVWLVLHLFGLAVGLTAIDPDHPRSLRGVGIGAGVWSLVAPILALFIGGLVAGRIAPTINSLNAAIHGAVVWALSSILAMFVVGSMLGSVARMATHTGAAVGSSAGAAISKLEGLDLSDVGLTGNDLVAPINARLQERGLPPVSAGGLEAAAKEALRESVRTGRIDREALIASVARNTRLSRPEAEMVAGEIQQRLDRLQAKATAGVERVRHGALEAAEASGKVMLAFSGALTLGLLAALGGAILAVRRERRTHVHLPRATTRVDVVRR